MNWRNIGILLFLLTICLGCHSEKNPYDIETCYVEGEVTLDGKTLDDAVIAFIPKTEGVGEEAAGRSKPDGSYKLSSLRGLPEKGAMEGEYIITVYKNEEVKLAVPKKTLDGEPITTEMKNIVPVIYKDVKKSPLSAKVNKGKNKIDLALKSN